MLGRLGLCVPPTLPSIIRIHVVADGTSLTQILSELDGGFQASGLTNGRPLTCIAVFGVCPGCQRAVLGDSSAKIQHGVGCTCLASLPVVLWVEVSIGDERRRCLLRNRFGMESPLQHIHTLRTDVHLHINTAQDGRSVGRCRRFWIRPDEPATLASNQPSLTSTIDTCVGSVLFGRPRGSRQQGCSHHDHHHVHAMDEDDDGNRRRRAPLLLPAPCSCYCCWRSPSSGCGPSISRRRHVFR